MFTQEIEVLLLDKYVPSSFKNAKSAVKWFYKNCLQKELNYFDPNDFINNIDRIYDFCLKYEKKSTISTYLGCIIGILNVIPEYKGKYTKLKDLNMQLVKEQQIKVQNENKPIEDINFENILLELEEKKKKAPCHYLKYILIALLAEFPHRLNELAELRINKIDGPCNYIDWEKKEIVIHNHKNSKKNKSIKRTKLSDKILNEIKEFTKQNNSEWVFPLRSNKSKHFTSSNLNAIILKILKGKGIHHIRHLKDSKKVKEFSDIVNNEGKVTAKTLLDLIEHTKQIGHSLETLIKVYLHDQIINE